MSSFSRSEFEVILTRLAASLTLESRSAEGFRNSGQFEKRCRELLVTETAGTGLEVDISPHPHVFPDIVMGEFGVEVKFTLNDSWRSIANIVFEGSRGIGVKHIYLLFGKMGGVPEVKWAAYEDSVIHVRTSHVPRFEVQIGERSSLLTKMGIDYQTFSALPIHERMEHIRTYARGRLKKGERLWWLEDQPDTGHSLPMQVRLYTKLETVEKRRLRGEAALLCPKIVCGSRVRDKYDDVTTYLLTYHGVLCNQARDLFSAGSVAMRSDETRGGLYIQRALLDIEMEMRDAAERLEERLFVEYWGKAVPVSDRIQEWLKRADQLAAGHWKPSETLFLKRSDSAITL